MYIDLNSPQGNAYSLINIVIKAGRQMGLKYGEIDEVVDKMKSGTYADLLDVMEDTFPGLFEFQNDPR